MHISILKLTVIFKYANYSNDKDTAKVCLPICCGATYTSLPALQKSHGGRGIKSNQRGPHETLKTSKSSDLPRLCGKQALSHVT